ncbi:putative allantoin permease [Tetrabaena socialis]|uniref:Putative allantoin permease n=1 Tax=Tetrabaena socialis TaxID=47790 RepID=A0A2J8A4A8_9CHLO|nr:putative allantoin permease [Tetrabaena socialis]|eukprot:PNH07349.1 putative allantoin permease [Tetrabaena socialis]
MRPRALSVFLHFARARMSWWQGILTVFFGNLITLGPMVLNGHPGTKYGVPFPVLARASFGIRGANLPSLSRALVACGWFGIQTWIGGSSIFQMLMAVTGGAVAGPVVGWLGISLPELACFMAFWAAQVWIVVRGMESIRLLERYSAPLLIGLSLALMGWAVTSAGGMGPMLSTPSQFGLGMPKEGQFWSVFWPAVTANVGYWATLSLNIPDFTRYAESQKAQGGWNTAALWALFVGILPTMPGFLSTLGVVSGLPPIWGQIYDVAWFVGVAVSSALYCLLMRGAPGAYKRGEEGAGGAGGVAATA